MNSIDNPILTHSTIKEDYFGTEIADPYRWLEELDAAQTLEWLANQNTSTTNFFSKHDFIRQLVEHQLLRLWRKPKYSVISNEGPYYFYWGLDAEPDQTQIQNQAVLYGRATLNDSSYRVIDPNTIDPSGKSAVTYQSFSPDGEFVAYTVSKNGSDSQSIYIRHTQTCVDFPEIIEGCKTVNIAWHTDSTGQNGFFYNWFVGGEETKNKISCIFWHQLGTPQSSDIVVFTPRGGELGLEFYPETSADGRFLILYATQGTERYNLIYYAALLTTTPGEFYILNPTTKAQFVFIGSMNNTLYFQTTWQAPKGQIIAVDVQVTTTSSANTNTNPNPPSTDPCSWRTVVLEKGEILTFVILAGRKFVVGYLDKAYHRLQIYNLDGSFDKEVELPPFCTISGLCGKPAKNELFIALESFISPPTIYRYKLNDARFEPILKSDSDFSQADYQTEQVFFISKDGTSISMFLTYKKGVILDGNNPTLLTGYGGFGISQTPIFLISHALWLERGGILAVPNIRGGGEYGQEWHQAGNLANKQNSFDDFCQAAEYLIANRYTRSVRLAIEGHSNGGLLVAAAVSQRPDLFGAVICRAPLTDMLRYHLFGAGHNWIAEYGSATAAEDQFRTLKAYSPLHNLHRVSYPPVLITVQFNDDRVHPLHSFKFLAALQENSTGETPLLLRVENEGGHGLGNTSNQMIAELTDIYTFLFTLFEMV